MGVDNLRNVDYNREYNLIGKMLACHVNYIGSKPIILELTFYNFRWGLCYIFSICY